MKFELYFRLKIKQDYNKNLEDLFIPVYVPNELHNFQWRAMGTGDVLWVNKSSQAPSQ